ncbi:ABC transporter ATP-binding protein [Oceanobacillus picturae]|uniref:ABC transporter ATP-binding protein n=1 Tax=Oceanobacillus picturae TaxID=171693 RepID=A0A0U9H9X1_9BACI|nr:ABC transporter ATP-binding protein [Oceanobacillus picturae]
MNTTAISVKDLKKSFKDKEVLKGLNFEVQKGEIFEFKKIKGTILCPKTFNESLKINHISFTCVSALPLLK